MILYAFNACGKSSLLRSIGLSVVMAQCGLYVPCDEMELKPFKRILTQVDMYDNLWKSHSSFMAEMAGLNKILKLADGDTLVLSDELTKGTEVKSATSLFCSGIMQLVKKGAKFVFTTHLHDVTKCEKIIKCKSLRICHLSVIIDGETIIFERKIKPGPTSEMYGIEVAKAMGLGDDFIEAAYEIREALFGKSALYKKKSKYNSKKILEKCEICGYYPKVKTDLPLDTHHINEQNTADEDNYIGVFHKNAKHNLVCLCKGCHGKVHNEEIKVHGYISTTQGVILRWENVQV
jgi:DNA mismatch repair protein MutS